MSISLNFNIFGNVLQRKQTNKRWISDPHIIFDGAHYIRKSLPHWQNRSNLDDVGLVNLPLFSFHDKRGQKCRGLRYFTYQYLLSFLGASSIDYCFLCYKKLLLFDRSICILAFLQISIWINLLILEIF